MKIEKRKETMTSKERVRRTFQFEKTDRVTIGYEANGNIHKNYYFLLNFYKKTARFAAGQTLRGQIPSHTGEKCLQISRLKHIIIYG